MATTSSREASEGEGKGDGASGGRHRWYEAALINRNFALSWGGQTVSLLGDFAFSTTLVLWIATRLAVGQTWAPLAVSGVLLAVALPTLLVGPLAGVFVDRWDRRKTMLRMDLLRAVLVCVLLAMALVGGGLPVFWQLGIIYGIVFLVTTCSQFFSPARVALINDIVEEEQRALASSRDFTTLSIAILLGPALAAPLFFAVGLQWTLLFDAVSFLVSFGAIWLVRVGGEGAQGDVGHGTFLSDLRAGLHFYAHNRVLMLLLCANVLAVFGAEALNTLDIFFLTRNLHSEPQLYGLLSTGAGVGLIVGSLCGGVAIRRLGLWRVFWLSLMVVGALILVYARQSSFFPAFLLQGLMGIPSATLNVTVMPLILKVTPKHLIGRVVAVLKPAISLAGAISVPLAGYLASVVLGGVHFSVWGGAFGAIDLIFLGTGMCILLAGVYAYVSLRMGGPIE